MNTTTGTKGLRKGMKVRFDRQSLGACPPDEHWRVDYAKPLKGDTGVVVAQHENRKMCRGWVWVEWQAPDGRKLHVGVTPSMVTVIK